MKIAVVHCLLRLIQNGNTNLLSVPKVGADALLVSEIPILRMINDVSEGGEDDCCVTNVSQVEVVEVTRGNELDRLKAKYGPRVVDTVYPGGRGLPSEVDDCELPSSSYDKRKAKTKEKAA